MTICTNLLDSYIVYIASMKKLSIIIAALLLILNISCNKENDPAPQSVQKQQLMAQDWRIDQIQTKTDYIMKTTNGDVPNKNQQLITGMSTKCEYAGTMRFADGGVVKIAYLQNFCGTKNPDAEQIKWSADDAVTSLTLTGKDLAGFSMGVDRNLTSMGNEATFDVKELTAEKLVIERTMKITDFLSQEVLDAYAGMGITLDGTYSYATTYIAQ